MQEASPSRLPRGEISINPFPSHWAWGVVAGWGMHDAKLSTARARASGLLHLDMVRKHTCLHMAWKRGIESRVPASSD